MDEALALSVWMCYFAHMAKGKLDDPGMVEMLRRTIEESGETYLGLANATGVQRSSISRFMDGQLNLRLDKADALARHLGLVLRKDKRR